MLLSPSMFLYLTQIEPRSKHIIVYLEEEEFDLITFSLNNIA